MNRFGRYLISGPEGTYQSLSHPIRWHLWCPRIWKDLMDMDIRVGKKRVARLIREMGICGVSRR
ncbi:MAG: transposase [Candidatus Latescibacteria bacterium]|nr:transposase [Candidatus Latescibacterota bacterium]